MGSPAAVVSVALPTTDPQLAALASRLGQAAAAGDSHEVSLVLKAAETDGVRLALLSAVDHNGPTALHRAAWAGHVNVIQQLLAVLGCPADLQDHLGMTALHAAVANKQLGTVKLLLDAAADPNLASSGGGRSRTPLWTAAAGAQQRQSTCCCAPTQKWKDPTQLGVRPLGQQRRVGM